MFCTTSETEREAGHVKLVEAPPPVINNIPFKVGSSDFGSLLPILVSEFWWRFTLCLFMLLLVRLLSGHLLGKLTIRRSLCILTLCTYSYLPFWFRAWTLGSDGSSSWSLHTYYPYSNNETLLTSWLLTHVWPISESEYRLFNVAYHLRGETYFGG